MTMLPEYIAIGHITKDLLPSGNWVPGGTVTFAALAARNLGARSAIITAAPADVRSLPLYHDIDIRGPHTEAATIFENIYRPEGREQYIRGLAPVIQSRDVPPKWAGSHQDIQIVHIAPIAQECSPDLVNFFPQALIGVTPQGFMREWDPSTGYVKPSEWAEAAHWLPRIGALILSQEDLPPGQRGRELLELYIELCPIVALTIGPRGCIIYQHGQSERVPAYPAHEIDPTGAGDVFAAAFLLRLRATEDPLAAARFANAAAGCNIEKTGATGVPSLQEAEARMSLTPI